VIWGYAHEDGTLINLGIYGPNGNLVANDTDSMPGHSTTGSSNFTANQVMSFPSNAPQVGLAADVSKYNISEGSDFTVALVANHSLWVAGWTAANRTGGTGLAYGQSPWEVPVTYEAPVGQYTALPSILPQPSFESSFELGVGGVANWTVEEGN
jgi:hypothetical protein